MTVPAKAVELYLDTRRLVEEQIRSYTEPYSAKLLPDLLPQERHVFTLVLDLNEKVIHYAWTDLSKLNRDLAKVLYLSGHALESCLQPENCLPIKAWQQQDKDDTFLVDFIPLHEFVARTSPADIRPVLASYQGCDIPTEFIRRSKEHQRRIQEQKQRGRLWRH
ncbi:Mitochondrial import inner membrane translocase subunit TIM50 [Quillaja saponaria]|uniref:Mitochondrial import inner membrane translocase subunit TIM50 n=1 Tax=Quillaja saponaria TaxID=32244 RepID=A0AAD7PQC5_QUISA|nr:Mitochondrial import inner membrane translocase subunit TIM50 [Quillaja saponaria]